MPLDTVNQAVYEQFEIDTLSLYLPCRQHDIYTTFTLEKTPPIPYCLSFDWLNRLLSVSSEKFSDTATAIG